MKIVLLLANCNTLILKGMQSTIIDVLTELDLDVVPISLENLPYFNGSTTIEMDNIMNHIAQSKGVIALCNVHLIGIHGSMQTFFDYLRLYEQDIFGKSLLTITYSNFWGEGDAANLINKGWRFLGGNDAGNVLFNSYLDPQEQLKLLEKKIENFYRGLKQDLPYMISSEHELYIKYSEKGGTPVVRSSQSTNRQTVNNFTKPISDEERDIQEISKLLKTQIQPEEQSFMPMGLYNKPQVSQVNTQHRALQVSKRLPNLCHYFVAHHERDLVLNVQYCVTDTKEKGYITINNGDCEYKEGVIDTFTVEITLSDNTLSELINKEITYQKAFMLGKIKVKGNFAVLPKLDQVFQTGSV
ncbi:hypothetical protein AN639_07120 [Candidatus Epulonipiscium fishelsonii]|uniref:Uncharacterized protein n=1 Tax=Candidatus Epulonipiscium fishelsonii TaxID=77094 RepID=A0ACC8XAV0_9FIRM|nr:hypothetical protein AN639_07120 [Epulopiscium sp. SCG-B05WGA-EpuloA1]ONI39414.1 hypothetical protein AN396_08395 [Epulopiscium sp. SCG-B11WGA-EpuloA1]ONI46852.1 hypothetical protein AN644_02390 [Epulopiscium sp. SCG-C06WGA-EpuloA1]